MVKLLSNMTGTRYFKTILSDDKGKWREIANGVPQGSVLAPTLFNVYISDMPETTSIKLGFADDWAIATRARGKVQQEETLTRDMQQIERYFRQWYLTVNTTKTVSSYFHLINREAEDTLSIRSLNNQLPSGQFPTYLGVTLYRSLSYKKHIGNVMQKLRKRTNLILKNFRNLMGRSPSSTENISHGTLLQCSRIRSPCLGPKLPCKKSGCQSK